MLILKQTLPVIVALSIMVSGCASVNLVPAEEMAQAKSFDTPKGNLSGLYVYRDSSFGSTLKKDIWVNGECLGESAPHVFFFTEVPSGEQKISTESEFSPNPLLITTEPGKNYFIRQYIKLGVFVGGANLEQVSEQKGRAAVAKLKMAAPGQCSK
ncbi:DUF2846 domain-containing protein [Uruburuella testudinis]|uniref:DUF2846 domain-containing protein n=1 Tax=Uruburuella testudinis TaxID=1282863 RepID=A0ABY4DT74_9NEIS|nr:DUF2846 domain-containing protein [Uruburuella testudinis]UOO82247.1 DUF2846 domain-containing protein [Uruburuella testudinis]